MSVKESTVELGSWFHKIEMEGDRTRDIALAPDPRPRNHPHGKWEAALSCLPDLQGNGALDLGCADVCFAIELARLGAKVDVGDGAGKWRGDCGGQPRCSISTSTREFAGVAATSSPMAIETVVAAGEQPYPWFKPPHDGVHSVPKW